MSIYVIFHLILNINKKSAVKTTAADKISLLYIMHLKLNWMTESRAAGIY